MFEGGRDMRPTKRLIGVGLGIAFLAALAVGANAGAQGESQELQLTPSRDSGVSGTATFQDSQGGVEVRLNIQGAPEGGVEHLAHIHEGATCADERNDKGGPIEFPLESIQTEDDGTGSSTTTIEGTTVAQLFDGSKERYVNVHDKVEGAGVPPGIACADLTSMTGGGSTTGAYTTGEYTTGGRQDATKLPKSGGVSPTVLLPAGVALVLGVVIGVFVLRRTST
jgi:hypothetical protein